MPITHSFVSAIADDGAASFVQPSNWNAAHTLPTHNETSSKQGGTTSEYYHLTAAQYAAVVAGGFTDSITLGGTTNETSFIKLTHLAGANVDTFQLIEYVSGYSTYPNNVTIQMSETGVNRDRLKLKATDDMSGFMLSLRTSAEGASRPYVSFSHPSASTDCPVMCFNMWAGQTNPCIQFADSNYVSPPMAAPPYSQVVSGAKGSRTYYFKTTYVTATGETTPCALVGPISMNANKLLRIVFPPAPDSRITDAKVYIHTSSGTLYWQDTVAISAYATTTWTETTGVLNTSGATPPTTNGTGGVQFTMSSVYHGIGFYMKGVGSQAYDYIKVANSSDYNVFRVSNSDRVYVRAEDFNVQRLSTGTNLMHVSSADAAVYIDGSLQVTNHMALTVAGENTMEATQGSISMTAQTSISMTAETNIVLTAAGPTNTITLSAAASANAITVGEEYIEFYRAMSASFTRISGSSLSFGGNNTFSIVLEANPLQYFQVIRSTFPIIYVHGDSLYVGIRTNAPTCELDIAADRIRIRNSRTPASAAATGNQGDICWDSSYVYLCTATNTWKRVPIATW